MFKDYVGFREFRVQVFKETLKRRMQLDFGLPRASSDKGHFIVGFGGSCHRNCQLDPRRSMLTSLNLNPKTLNF